MEPVDDGQVGSEPIVGWRAWALAENRLYSIALDAFWRPGENQATCLAGRGHDPPARSCHCGFWALRNPMPAMHRAVQVSFRSHVRYHSARPLPRVVPAVGLITGYGAISVHGSEGYRAALASVACIFSDAPEPDSAENADLRRMVADEYSVPCITLEGAISIGFLQELGVDAAAVEQLKTWIATGRPLWAPQQLAPPVPTPPPAGPGPRWTSLTQAELDVARSLATGSTTREIAGRIGLNQRALEFQVYRIIEKTNSRNRADLARWVKEHDR